MTKFLKPLIAAMIVSGAMTVAGCSSSPSEEQLKQLDALTQEVSCLEKQVGDKTREKADLDKQIADKNARLQQCQSDQEAVKKGLGK